MGTIPFIYIGLEFVINPSSIIDCGLTGSTHTREYFNQITLSGSIYYDTIGCVIKLICKFTYWEIKST